MGANTTRGSRTKHQAQETNNYQNKTESNLNGETQTQMNLIQGLTQEDDNKL